MKSTSAVILVVFVVLAILHQDQWNWDNANLVCGFMPVGLAYHAGYSIIAAIFWAVVLKLAWPAALEKWADDEEDEAKGDADSNAS